MVSLVVAAGSTDAELGSTNGNPGTLNLRTCPGSIAADAFRGDRPRRSVIVDEAMFEPNAK